MRGLVYYLLEHVKLPGKGVGSFVLCLPQALPQRLAVSFFGIVFTASRAGKNTNAYRVINKLPAGLNVQVNK